jgi:D-alanyl-D-alanine dipeptidase
VLALVLSLATLTAPPSAPADDALVVLEHIEPRWRFDLVYARADNFAGRVIYTHAVCALRRGVAQELRGAQRYLDQHHAGLVLLFKDCYRPDHAQRVLFAAVRGTPKARYVADPRGARGSMHSYGAAVDVTLADADGRELDLGTPHDFLGALAEPRLEARFVAEGKLTAAQVERRAILRAAMRAGGMRSIPNEWWHFDAGRHDEIVARYSRLDVALDAIATPGRD